MADRIRARDVAISHGAVDMQKLNPFERMMFKMAKSVGGDSRDWDAIAAWAAGIAAALKEGQPT
jgi:menaquinone-dependent protoporphyrinogen oxidase